MFVGGEGSGAGDARWEIADLGCEVGGHAEKSRERPEPRGVSI